jgi:hypothetical protein
MRTPSRFRAFFFLTCLFALSNRSRCEALTIVSSGDWSLPIGASDLVGGAGTDLPGSFESASDLISIDIAGTTGAGDNWRVDVKKTDGTWNANLHLNTYRTGAGSGPGSVSGGTSYQEITGTDASFFSGDGDRSGITVRLKLSGVSVHVPPATYGATVTITVVDN